MAERNNDIVYLQARPQDLESLTTLIPRAFHPVNPFMKKLLPDTPAMRSWWRNVFEEYVSSSDCHLPIAIDTSNDSVIGGVVFRMVEPGGKHGGFVGKYPATEDHDPEVWPQAVEEFAADEKRTMGDRGRFLIEVMGVDHAYQGKGIGSKLVDMACDIADAKSYPIFLETTQARDFYLKLGRGFEVVQTFEDAGIGPRPGGTMIREPAKISG